MHQYPYSDSVPTWGYQYLWPVLKNVIQSRTWPVKRAFDLGCGNGATLKMLHSEGFEVTGIDPSNSGVAIAQRELPQATLAIASAYDDLAGQFGRFPLVVSLEVIEHCAEPRRFMRSFLDLIEPGGTGVLSTPYHGYWKNLALALSGKLEGHFGALWDGGHIKFFSIKTLAALLSEMSADDFFIKRTGRFPLIAKSMVAVVSKT